MKLFPKILALLLLSVMVYSCGTDPTREERVSILIDKVNDPFLIVNTNPKSLIDKSGAMEGALPFTQEMLIGFFMDEETTGVDNSVNVQIVMGKGGGFMPEVYGIFKIKEEDRFIELLETEANATVEEKEGFKYVKKESDNYVIVWNDEFAIAANGTYKLTDIFNNSGDPSMKAVNRCIGLIKAADENEVNEKYATFLKESADIAIMFEGKGLYGYLEEASMGQSKELTENKESISGASSKMFIDFNDGSLDISATNTLSDQLMQDLSFLMNDPIGKDLLVYGNSKSPLMMMGYHFNVTEGLDYAKEKVGMDEYENFLEELEEVGVDVETFKSALSGEFLMMIDRIEVVEKTYDWGYGDPYVTQEPLPIVGLVMGVEDRETMKGLFPDSLGFDGVMANGDMFMFLNDDIFFATSDSLWAGRVATGTTVKLEDPQGVFNDRPIGVFMDFMQFDHLAEMQEARPIIESLEFMKLNASLTQMDFSLVFKDKSQNALRILTETISRLMEPEFEGEEYKQIEAELEEAAAAEAAMETAE